MISPLHIPVLLVAPLWKHLLLTVLPAKASISITVLPDRQDVPLPEVPLSLAGIIDYLRLRRPVYRQVASYGHFGRNDLDLTWELIKKIG